MPIKKFRSVEEMGDNTWRSPGDPELEKAIRATWDLAHQTLQPYYPPGVYKHRSYEDMKRQSDEWARQNFERYQARLAAERKKSKEKK